MTYADRLAAVKAHYPFEEWSEKFYPDENDIGGLDQYSPENCDAAADVINELIAGLQTAGENAAEATKLALFERAVKAFNEMNEEIPGFIETEEREDLCDLFEMITVAAGLEPEVYAEGDGITDLWREW